ncbi:hypothetical protein SAMN05216409_107169 [Pseudomonas lutea]|uniref:Uncharacterized protein n=1 Tax=Pseudomonas lutea TaxID=243924 RepID=A0A9X8MDB3_9PSED|nr:hypothetical protein SAMN05216409_107169 [Pseudomonas lutea]
MQEEPSSCSKLPHSTGTKRVYSDKQRGVRLKQKHLNILHGWFVMNRFTQTNCLAIPTQRNALTLTH